MVVTCYTIICLTTLWSIFNVWNCSVEMVREWSQCNKASIKGGMFQWICGSIEGDG
jgi:hypothetical protein